jgi:hypothetical protein
VTAIAMHFRLGSLAGALLLGAVGIAGAQSRVHERVAVARDVAIRVWLPAGSLRLIGWDRDSLAIDGDVASGEKFVFGGGGTAVKFSVGAPMSSVKFGVEDLPPGQASRPSHLTAYIPRNARVNVRTVSATIEASDVSGWFNSVSGNIRLTGAASEIQAETMEGTVDLAVTAPWIRTRTASGALTVAGRVEDLGAATVSGNLTVNTQGLARAKLESMTGVIQMAAQPADEAVIDIDNHGGLVDLRLTRDFAGDFDLTSVAGTITNEFTKHRPVAGRKSLGQTLVFATDTTGARLVVRTFKGPIVLRRR